MKFKLILLALVFALAANAQKAAVMYTGQPGAVPIAVGSGTGTLTNLVCNGGLTGGTITTTGTCAADKTLLAQKFFGTAAPGSVAGNLPGDFFSDTTNNIIYQCNAASGTAAPACTTTGAGNWMPVNINVTPGSGVSSTTDPTTLIQTLSTDPTIVPRYFTSAGVPSGNCTAGRDFDTDTTNLNLYFCDAANTWKLSGVGPGNSVTSTTPVTVTANTTSEQFLMELTLTAGYLNSSKQPFLFNGAGVYTTPAAQTPTLTFKVKLCTVSGCGSGTVVTLASIVTTATLASVTNDNWNLNLIGYTATTGASGNLEIHGPLSVDLGALTTTADSIFNDVNTAVSSNIDLTAALFVDFSVTISTGSASNSVTQRQGGVMPFAATAAPVTSVNTLTGAVTLFTTNAKTSTYQVLASDFTGCKTIPVASGTFTITLVASGAQPPSGQCINIINYGTGVVTLARSGQNINGAAGNLTGAAGSATAPTGFYVVSDGTNYIASLWSTGGGSSSQTLVYSFASAANNESLPLTSSFCDANQNVFGVAQTGPNSIAYHEGTIILSANDWVEGCATTSSTWSGAAGTVDIALSEYNVDGAPGGGTSWNLKFYVGCAAAASAFTYGAATTVTVTPPSAGHSTFTATGVALPAACGPGVPIQFWMQRGADTPSATGVRVAVIGMMATIRGN